MNIMEILDCEGKMFAKLTVIKFMILQLPDCDLSSTSDTVTTTGSDNLPDHITKANGRVELTTLGRYQVMQAYNISGA